ncbi:hypothetical protein HPNQ4076_1008 [Helicobacter pylori NQ4076]|uniref:Uncharacterized protein n=1 Tax=Helicobacter pylori NQ4076 TaxID=992029 RepID=I9QNX3_HELPX|nr:hypothetical protein HPNQ4076_1008 [Helicobacter pylori NQ4076]
MGFDLTLYNPHLKKQPKPLSNHLIVGITPQERFIKSYHSQKAQRSRLIEVLKRLIKNF